MTTGRVGVSDTAIDELSSGNILMSHAGRFLLLLLLRGGGGFSRLGDYLKVRGLGMKLKTAEIFFGMADFAEDVVFF